MLVGSFPVLNMPAGGFVAGYFWTNPLSIITSLRCRSLFLESEGKAKAFSCSSVGVLSVVRPLIPPLVQGPIVMKLDTLWFGVKLTQKQDD